MLVLKKIAYVFRVMSMHMHTINDSAFVFNNTVRLLTLNDKLCRNKTLQITNYNLIAT